MLLNCGAGEYSWESLGWTARRSSQSILKEISSEYSLEGLTLKRRYFGHLLLRTDSSEKTLMLGKIESRKRKGQQRMRWLDGMRWWWTGKPGEPQSMGSRRVRYDWGAEHSAAVVSHAITSDSATPWAVACQALLSMGFLRQEYCNGLPFPSPDDFPGPGIKPSASPALAGEFFTTEPPGKL